MSDTYNKLQYGKKYDHWKILDFILDFNSFYFPNCNINPNPTHLPKHQPLSPNHQFYQRIWYIECCSVHAQPIWHEVRNFASQKLLLTPVIQPPTLLWNVLFCPFLLTSVVQIECVYTMDLVSAGKNTLLSYVTVCEKVVPRLNKHDDFIEWNFMNIAPSKWRAGCAPSLMP